MRIIDILTRPLVSKETRNLLGFIFVTGIWTFMLFSGLHSGRYDEGGDLFGMALMQLMMIIFYADYKASVVRKELLEEQEKILFTLKAMEHAKNL